MKRNALAVVLTILSTNPVWAVDTTTDSTYKIRQVITEQNLVVAETSSPEENLPTGKIFLVTFPDDKQCSLSLVEQKGKLLTLNSSACVNRKEITRSLHLEISLIDSPTPPATAVSTPPQESPATTVEEFEDLSSGQWNRARLGLSIHYSTANEAKFDDAYVSTDSGSGTLSADFKTKTAVGIGVSLSRMKVQNWGYVTSLFFEMGREVDSVTFSGPGGTASSSFTSKPKLALFVAEGAVLYRWNSFYLPFGLNISAPALYDTGNTTTDVSGSIGAFLGAGFILADHSTLDIFVRSISMRMRQSDSTGYIDYALGTMSGLGIGYKYWF